VIPRDYIIEDNFETGMLVASEAGLTATMLQAGNTALMGTITSAVMPSPVPRSSLTKAGIMANIGNTNDLAITAIDCSPVVIGAGDGMPYTFSGNFVDNPDDYVFQYNGAMTNVPVTGQLLAYAGGNGVGGLPDYITSSVDVSVNVTLVPAAAPIAANAYATRIALFFDYATVDTAGTLIVNSVSYNASSYVTGPMLLQAVGTGGSTRIMNPTKTGDITSYLMGVRGYLTYRNETTGVNVAFGGGTIELSVRMPNMSPPFRAGDKLIVVQNYVGPVTMLYNQHWMARPNTQRQADYRNQLRVPYPSVYRDAVLDCVYTTLGSSMGRVFADRGKFDYFIKQMDQPHTIMNAIAHPDPGVTPDFLSDHAVQETESSVRAPILHAARYRVDMNTPHSQFNSSLWSGLLGVAKGVGRAVAPTVGQGVTNAISALLGDGDYKSSRYSATLPEYGSVEYHATATGCETKFDGDETSFDELEGPDSPVEVRMFISSFKSQFDKDPTWGSSDIASFLYEAKYVDRDFYDRLHWIRNYMAGRKPKLECLAKECYCCIRHFKSSSAPPKPVEIEFTPTNARVRVQPTSATYIHRQLVAATLHSSGYQPNAPDARHKLSTAGVENVGKLRSSGLQEFKIHYDQSGDEEDIDRLIAQAEATVPVADSDVEEDQPPPVRRPAAPAKVAPKKKVTRPQLSDDEDDLMNPIDVVDRKLDSPPATADYGELSSTDLTAMMNPVSSGFLADLTSSGAGPLISARAAGRIANVGKPGGPSYHSSTANFLLVGKGGVYIATIAVTDLPLSRKYEMFQKRGEMDKLPAYLRTTYALNAVQKIRTGVGGKADIVNYHVGLEFNPSTHPYIKKVVDVYHAMVSPKPGSHKFISVELFGRPIDPGGIDGDSFSLALLCALLGLPCGPAMTGGVSTDGEITPVGDIKTKVGPFYKHTDQIFGPLIYPAGLVRYPDSAGFNVMCNLNSWTYIFERGVYQVTTVRDVIGFFTSGGYRSWAERMDPTGNKQATMDRIYDAAAAAMGVGLAKRNLLASLQQLPLAITTYGEGSETVESLKRRITSLKEQVGRAKGLAETGFKHTTTAVKKASPEFIKVLTEANQNLSRLRSAKNKYYARNNQTNELTKDFSTSLKKYDDKFPVTSLRGKPIPEDKLEMYAAYRKLHGRFMAEGERWVFLPRIESFSPEVIDIPFEDLFKDVAAIAPMTKAEKKKLKKEEEAKD